MLKSQTGHCLTKSLTTTMRKQDAKQPVEGYRRQMWHRRAGHTCGGTTLVHMVYSRSRKVVCHSSRADPTAAMALSKAASLVKKSTASLSVSATAHSTQNWTPHSNRQSASHVEELMSLTPCWSMKQTHMLRVTCIFQLVFRFGSK